MPRKSKTNRLPSGSCRVSAYDYTDNSGKRHYKSFTAPTLSEAKAMRNEWKVLRKNRPEPLEDPLAGLTVFLICHSLTHRKQSLILSACSPLL